MSSCYLANAKAAICTRPTENVIYVFERYRFSITTPYIVLVLLGMFLRWEESGCTAAVLQSVASRIYQKQHAVFFYCPCLFYLSIYIYIYIFTNSTAWTGRDTRSISKRNFTGLNLEFSFCWNGIIVNKVCNLSGVWPEGSLFNSYYTKA